MKGMLTGPVSILARSFVRDDQPLGETANQVGLALRDEISDLEAAGIKVIQVDEPALCELLPLRKADHADYLKWSVDSFRLATAVKHVPSRQLWVKPDCGLKARGYVETEESLRSLVKATRTVRATLLQPAK